jgi:alkanesulfonate monooxygenase SsuD/methylene tetrahydromethanopterin reductase-like flavin-dependent oxidoreductase (luciferase family)
VAAGALAVGVCSWSMQSTYMRPRSHRELYREALREAQLAESLGYDSLWMGEHHFAYDGYCPSLMVAAARILAGTSRLKVGSGIMILPLHDPERIAEGAAAVNSFAPGRLRLGLAGGWREVEYLASGLELRDRARLLDEYLAALVDGEYADRLGGTELFMGGGSAAALRRAGRFGLSPLLAYAGPAESAERRGVWQQHLRQRARQAPRLATIRDVWVDRDPARLDWIRARMREMWRFYARFDDAKVREHHVPGEKPADDVEANIPSMMRYGTLGGPDEVREELAEIVRTGVDELVLRVRFDGIDSRYVEECLRLLADEVVPGLRDVR